MAGKLYAYTDTLGEAKKSQKAWLKKGVYTLINKEYGKYAVRSIPKAKMKRAKEIIKRRERRKPQKSKSSFGIEIKLPTFRL